MVVVAPGFVKLGRLTGVNNGVPALQVAVYPNAFDLDTDKALVDNTVKQVVPQIIKVLTTPIPASELQEQQKTSKDKVVFTGTLEQINRYFSDQGWSDGMAVAPPTVSRIKEFLKYTDYAPDQEIAVLPAANLRATPWNIAANAVMAGARPEYMPILISMVQAIGDPKYKLGWSVRAGSTHSFNTYYWLNGPVARQLGVDFGQGLIASPVNKVLGRTMSLIERNIAGYQIKLTQVGTFGQLTSWVLAEDEASDLRVGWKPYQVQKGYDLNTNTVTTGESTIWGQNLIPATSDAKILMQLMAYDLVQKEQFAAGWIGSDRAILVTPAIAKVLADGGYTKEKLKADLVKTARIPTYTWAFSKVYGSFGAIYPPFEEELAKTMADPDAEKGKLPPWFPRFPGWENIKTTPVVGKTPFSRGGRTRPPTDNLVILVLGDPSRNKTQTLPAAGYETKEIRLPKNWDELMKKAGYHPLRDFYLSPQKGVVAANDVKSQQ